MSVGVQYTKAQVDAFSGDLYVNIELAILRAERFALWLQATSDPTLQAAPYNYTAGEVATLKSAYVTDFLQLLTIYRGTATLGVAKDFRTFLKQLWGAGI